MVQPLSIEAFQEAKEKPLCPSSLGANQESNTNEKSTRVATCGMLDMRKSVRRGALVGIALVRCGFDVMAVAAWHGKFIAEFSDRVISNW